MNYFNNSVFADYIESANKLANDGVIVDNSANTSEYRPNDNITRGESAKVVYNMMEVK